MTKSGSLNAELEKVVGSGEGGRVGGWVRAVKGIGGEWNDLAGMWEKDNKRKEL